CDDLEPRAPGNVSLPARKARLEPAPLPPLAGHPTVSRSPAGSVAPSTRRGPLAQSAPVRRQDPTAAMTQPFPATTRRRNRTFQAGGGPALPVLKTGRKGAKPRVITDGCSPRERKRERTRTTPLVSPPRRDGRPTARRSETLSSQCTKPAAERTALQPT